MKQILFNMATSEKRAAIVENGKLIEILIERPNAYPKAGNIYVGRVVKVLPGIQAAFIDIGFDQNGFIHDSDLYQGIHQEKATISERVHEGQLKIVQVKKEASKSKGPLLTENVTLPGENLVYMPYGNYIAVSKKLNDEETVMMKELGEQLVMDREGLIMRTSSSDAEVGLLEQETVRLRERWEKLCNYADKNNGIGLLFEGNSLIERALNHISTEQVECIFDEFNNYKAFKRKYPHLGNQSKMYKRPENIFHFYGVEQSIHKALQPVVWLKNGGYINIDHTEALTVIDVNTGKFIGKQDRQQSILETNLHAAEETCKQLRLRNLSGMVVIDFIRMKNEEHQNKIKHRLEECLKNDPVQTRVHGFTALGLMEMTRQKVKDSLTAQLTEQCYCCKAHHRQLSIESNYYSIERTVFEYRNTVEEGIWIEVSKPLLQFIRNPEKDWEDRLTSLVSAKLYITENSHTEHPSFHLKHIGDCREIESRINKELH